jgi:hypothetical protein
MNGKRNRRAGLSYERAIVKRFNGMQIELENGEMIYPFPKLSSTRAANRRMDAMKIDITTEDDREHKKFGLTIQAKNTISTVSYAKIFKLMEPGIEKFGGIPIIYHKLSKRADKNFTVIDEFAILKASDFEEIFLNNRIKEMAMEKVQQYLIGKNSKEALIRYLKSLKLWKN